MLSQNFHVGSNVFGVPEHHCTKICVYSQNLSMTVCSLLAVSLQNLFFSQSHLKFLAYVTIIQAFSKLDIHVFIKEIKLIADMMLKTL